LIADFRASPTRSDCQPVDGPSRSERTFQEVDQTETTAGWGEIRSTPTDRVDMTLRLTREERRLDDDYTALADVVPEENPLLRKYHLASRDRDQVAARIISYMVSDRVNLGRLRPTMPRMTIDRSRKWASSMPATIAYTVDISAAPRDNLTVSAFYGQRTASSRRMASSAAFGVPRLDRRSEGHHRFLRPDTRGTGSLASDGFDAGIDYGYSSGKGRITMRTGFPTASNRFPTSNPGLNTVRLFGRYRLSDKLSVRVDYLYERYRSKDFALDDVAPDTIPSVLTLGEESPNYSAHFIGTSLNYRF
jgi:hypothetical protein